MKILLVFLQIFVFVFGSSLDNDISCNIKWKDNGVLEDMEKWEETNKKCLETNMFDDTAITEKFSINSTLEEFIEVDDNCFVHCVYKADELLTPENHINKNETLRAFKGNLTTEVFDKAVLIWDECIRDSEKIANAKASGTCRMLSLHDFCFTKRAMEGGLFQVECQEKPPSS